jgi:carboxypeptidase C (cathepsin A)
MLYIDQPIDVGFSYSTPIPAYQLSTEGGAQISLIGLPDNVCPDYLSKEEAATCGTWSDSSLKYTPNSTINARNDLWTTLQGFVGAFPQYSKGGFHMACESFGGHYCPVYSKYEQYAPRRLRHNILIVFCSYILEQNSLIRSGELPGAQEVDLKAVLIGNGWFDAYIQYQSNYNFTVEPGNTYDVQIWPPKVREAYYNWIWGPRNCLDQLQQCTQTGRDDICSYASLWCPSTVEDSSLTDRDWYDLRQTSADLDPPLFAPNVYLGRPEIQEALGIAVNFTWNSNLVSDVTLQSTGSDIARTEGVVEDMRELASSGVYVVQYHGDADIACNWYGGEAVMQAINAPGIDIAGYENFTSRDNATVWGQVKQSDNYAFVRVYEAGHEVPYYQPLFALEMLDRTLKGLDLASGTKAIALGSGYRTVGSPTSDFREGNATVQF